MTNGRTAAQRAAMRKVALKLWEDGRLPRRFSDEHRGGISRGVGDHWGRSFYDRILSKVDRSGGPDACWPWTGTCDTKGYGRAKHRGRVIKAHRVVYELLTGRELLDSEILLHDCQPLPDNPACCNPKHLRPGTLQQNCEDAIRKGQVLQGSRHHAAKLTEAQVLDMRQRYAVGEPTALLAREAGISPQVALRIVLGHSWKHVAYIPRPTHLDKPRLTDDQAIEIRQRRAAGETVRTLAAEFGVSTVTVWAVTKGRSHKHLPLVPGVE